MLLLNNFICVIYPLQFVLNCSCAINPFIASETRKDCLADDDWRCTLCNAMSGFCTLPLKSFQEKIWQHGMQIIIISCKLSNKRLLFSSGFLSIFFARFLKTLTLRYIWRILAILAFLKISCFCTAKVNCLLNFKLKFWSSLKIPTGLRNKFIFKILDFWNLGRR